MLIGLTYDLRREYLEAGFGEEETAEFDRPDTVDFIENALRELGHRTERIGHAIALAGRLAGGAHWDLVFNIAEGLSGVSREAQVPAMLEAFQIPCTFSDPLVSALTLDKAITKRVLRDLGLPTAPFAVIETIAALDRLDMPYPLFVKPLAEGTAKGIDGRSRVDSIDRLRNVVARVLDEFRQPALVEAYLPGREFTVGITGTGLRAEAAGTLEIVLLPEAEPHSYTYVNKERCEELCQFPLAPPEWAARAEELALAAWRGLGCRDAGRVDLRADANGDLQLLEINPLPGLHPSHSDLPMLCTAVGMPYLELIQRIIESAKSRVRPPDPRLAALGRKRLASKRSMPVGS
ncbi:MAG: D-alanine--D-alanine ligase [Planctomycetota bacterium]|nr:D-alanine--D-alanine ligase [Planctomycetota bacterium]